MRATFLGWALHHANRRMHSRGAKPEFYRIKTLLLQKYGTKLSEFDIQRIPGKPCYSCQGTGTIHWPDDDFEDDICDNCGGTGLYKRARFVRLDKFRLGKYTFHQPTEIYIKEEEVPKVEKPVIEGYIEHTPSKYSDRCTVLLFWLYSPSFRAKHWRQFKDQFRVLKYAAIPNMDSAEPDDLPF